MRGLAALLGGGPVIRYAFDLYPRVNPVSGARVRRLSQLQDAEYRGEANGTGAGRIVVRGTSTDAGYIDPKGMQYIRVVRINTAVADGSTLSGFSEKVVGGFFLENGDYEALTEHSTKKLTFGGAGTLSYLARDVMAPHTYVDIAPPLTAAYAGVGDDLWRLYLQGLSIGATANSIGALLWRVIAEAQGTARPYHYLADVTMTFDPFVDTDSNSWVVETGDFTAQVTEGIISVVQRLMQAGLYAYMDPDTFELSAWETANHGRDRTGLAWGANVVRFQAPTDGTIATGNIKSDAKRGIGALIKRTALWVGADDHYELVTQAGDVGWAGGYRVQDESGASFAAVGAAQLAARNDAGDTVRLRLMLGNAPATGAYLPFEHVQLDDRVTLHTGSGQWDWDETSQKVAAITLKLRPAGDWDAWVDLGSKYSSIEQRAFQNMPVGAHTHPPNPRLCDLARNVLLGVAAASLKVSSTHGSNVKTNVVDGDFAIATAIPHWSNDGPNGVDEAYWAADISSAQPVQAYHIRQGYTQSGVGTPPEGATEMKLYGSNDAAAWSWLPSGNLVADPASNSWTLVSTISSPSAEGDDTGLTAMPSASYRYWLLRASTGPAAGVGTGWNIQEFELWSNPHAGVSSKASRCDHGHYADEIDYDNATSGLAATEVQAAIDELATRSWKQPVRAATTANGTLATAFANGQTIDGVVLVTGDRILLKDQTARPENGIYAVNASGAPTRATDFNAGTKALGSVVLVTNGTVNADKVYVCTTNASINLGTTALVFAEMAGGVTDHGLLTGLADDDHPQYATNTEFDDHNARHEPSGADPMAVDAPAATGSLRTLGTSATQAAVGSHVHAGDSSKASATADLTATTTTAADVTGATLSLVAGTYIVIGNFDVSIKGNADRLFEGILDVDGTDENDLAVLLGVGLDTDDRQQVLQVWRVTLASTLTVKLQARHSGGTAGDFTVNAANTTLTAYVAGSSRGSWEQDVNESGASFANFTAGSGTWASDGTVFTQTDTAASRRAKYNILLPLSLPIVFEAEVNFPSAGQTTSADQNIALIFGFNGSAPAAPVVRFHFNNGAVPKIEIENDATTARLSVTPTGSFAYDQWIKIRGVYNVSMLTMYCNGTLYGTAGVAVSSDSRYVGLLTSNCKGQIRNIKLWALQGGLPV